MRVVLKPGGVLVVLVGLTALAFFALNDVDGIFGRRGGGAPAEAAVISPLSSAADEERVGSRVLPFRPINLSVSGPLDWAHWGLTDDSAALPAQRVVRKAGVTVHRIGDLEFVGGDAPEAYENDVRSFRWDDGDGAFPSVQNTQAGLALSGVGRGFRLTVPVEDGERRTLRLWAGGAGARGKLVVRLSDGTPINKLEPSTIGSEATGYSTLYTIKYKGTGPGQKVIVSYLLAEGDGSISFQAAAVD